MHYENYFKTKKMNPLAVTQILPKPQYNILTPPPQKCTKMDPPPCPRLVQYPRLPPPLYMIFTIKHCMTDNLHYGNCH